MALGREAKVQIVFTPDSVEGRKSKGVRGRMTVDASLTRLLEGSGLSSRKVNGGSYVVYGPSYESYDKARRLPSDIGHCYVYCNVPQEFPELLIIVQARGTT